MAGYDWTSGMPANLLFSNMALVCGTSVSEWASGARLAVGPTYRLGFGLWLEGGGGPWFMM